VDFEHALADFRDFEFRAPHVDADATFRRWLRSPFQAKKSGVRGAWGGPRMVPEPPPGWLPGETPMQRARRLEREEQALGKAAAE
jgi:hypothetical protein